MSFSRLYPYIYLLSLLPTGSVASFSSVMTKHRCRQVRRRRRPGSEHRCYLLSLSISSYHFSSPLVDPLLRWFFRVIRLGHFTPCERLSVMGSELYIDDAETVNFAVVWAVRGDHEIRCFRYRRRISKSC